MSPAQILQGAKALACPAVALTDTGSGHGLIDFVQQSKKIEGIKPLLGAEVFVAKDSRFEKRTGLDGHEGYLVLIAKSLVGYQNLLKILSIGHLQGHYQQPRVDWEILERYKEDLICLTGSRNGLLGKYLLQEGPESTKKIFEKIKDTFNDNLYLEFCADSHEDQENLNQFVLKLAQSSNTPTVATSNARFVSEAEAEAADTLYCIGKNQAVHDVYRDKFMAGKWFRNWKEITELLSSIPEAVLEASRQNTLAIAQQINFELEFDRSLLPDFAVEVGNTPATQLRKDCEQQIKTRYQTLQARASAQERLDYELSIISKMGFDSYFLIVADLIDFAKENGIAVAYTLKHLQIH